MANKALATRQRMQFRVEPAQMPARLKNQRGANLVAAYAKPKPLRDVQPNRPNLPSQQNQQHQQHQQNSMSGITDDADTNNKLNRD